MKRILITALTLLPLPALATLPASAAQVFCAGIVVVVARVQAATSEDCRLHLSGNCSPQNGVRLSIVVSEVLAVSKDDPTNPIEETSFTASRVTNLIGQTLDVHVSASHQTFLMGADDEDTPSTGGYLVAPNSDPLTDADVQRLYAGETFVFSLQPSQRPASEPHWGTVWPLKSRAWVMKTLKKSAGNECPAPLT